MIQVFHCPGFLGSRFFRIRIKGLGPRFRSSPTSVHTLSYIEEEKCENKSKVPEVHKMHHYTIIK